MSVCDGESAGASEFEARRAGRLLRSSINSCIVFENDAGCAAPELLEFLPAANSSYALTTTCTVVVGCGSHVAICQR